MKENIKYKVSNIKLYILYFIFAMFSLLYNNKIIAQDITPPDTPILDSVSVIDPSGYIYLGWEFSDSLDVAGYIIYRQNGSIWQTIDTVKSPFVNFYIDSSAVGNQHLEMYRIAAYDSSLNRSPMTDIENAQNTMYSIPNIKEENCVSKINLKWNAYIGWSNGVYEYRIYYSVNNSPFTLLTSVESAVTSYDHVNLLDTTTYCYYIRAVSTDGKTSTSNKICKFIDLPNVQKYSYINFVSDTGELNQLNLSFSVDTAADVRNYKLLRRDEYTSFFDTIVDFNIVSQSPYLYTDYVENLTTKYYYKLIAYNNCNAIVKESNIARNIVLKAKEKRDTVKLSWNPYINWENGVDKYNVYRIDDNGQHILIKTATNFDSICKYDITDVLIKDTTISGHLCFYIEAIELDTNKYRIQGRSKSNIVCINKEPYVYMPNAFSPNNDKINDVFKPSTRCISNNDYTFIIYDRWGKTIYKTTILNKGWDGKYNGIMVKGGVYCYLVQYKSNSNDYFEKCGYFTVIR